MYFRTLLRVLKRIFQSTLWALETLFLTITFQTKCYYNLSTTPPSESAANDPEWLEGTRMANQIDSKTTLSLAIVHGVVILAFFCGRDYSFHTHRISNLEDKQTKIEAILEKLVDTVQAMNKKLPE